MQGYAVILTLPLLGNLCGQSNYALVDMPVNLVKEIESVLMIRRDISL